MQVKYLTAIILILIAGCKKETAGLTADLKGTWELISTDGEWSGHHDYAPGNGNTFTFNGDNYAQHVIIADSTYHYAGTFSIYTGKPCDGAGEQTLIIFDNTQVCSKQELTVF